MAAWWSCADGAPLIVAAQAAVLAASLLLGGLLPLEDRAREQWPPSGAWRLPVGDAYAISNERPIEPGPFFVLRGLEYEGGRRTHDGADLGCGSAGAPVRAAAAGLVVRAADHGEYGGYGSHIVIAHRLARGELAYSIYAHLRLASLRVRAGQRVNAGQVIARVGATGRVTTPHLHFEVRRAGDLEQRWELARIEDPLAFVHERLPEHRGDTTGVDAYLEWGECAGLLSGGARGDDALTREQWWRMLAAAVRGPVLDPGLDAGALRGALVESALIPPGGSPGSPGAVAHWREVARDLGRARSHGVRTGPAPFRRAAHRALCEQVLGSANPASHLAAFSGRDRHPTVTEAVLLLADLGGPQPEPPKPPKVARRPATGGAHPPTAPTRTTRRRPRTADSTLTMPVPPDSAHAH